MSSYVNHRVGQERRQNGEVSDEEVNISTTTPLALIAPNYKQLVNRAHMWKSMAVIDCRKKKRKKRQNPVRQSAYKTRPPAHTHAIAHAQQNNADQ